MALASLLLSLIAVILSLIAIAQKRPVIALHELLTVGRNAAPTSEEASLAAPRVTTQTYLAAIGRRPIPGPAETIDRLIPADHLNPESGVPPPRVPWTEAHRHIDRIIAAEGRIVGTYNTGKLTFLNFQDNWRGQFCIVIFKQVYDRVPDSAPERYYLHKTIRVTGPVRLYQNQPQIQVRDINQVEVIP